LGVPANLLISPEHRGLSIREKYLSTFDNAEVSHNLEGEGRTCSTSGEPLNKRIADKIDKRWPAETANAT